MADVVKHETSGAVSLLNTSGAPLAAGEERRGRAPEALHLTLRTLADANERFQDLNQRLHKLSEKLHVANENLKTTNNDLRQTNHDLVEANDILRAKCSTLEATLADVETLAGLGTGPSLSVGRDLKLRLFTSEARRLFAIRKSDLGQPLESIPRFFQPEDLHAHLERVLASKQSHTITVRAQTQTFALRINPYTVGERVEGLVLSFFDISVAEAARLEIATQADLLQTTLDGADVGLACTDRDGTCICANARFRNELGDKWVGTDLMDLFGQVAPGAQGVQDKISQGETQSYEVFALETSTGRRDLLVTVTPRLTDGGGVEGAIVQVVDTTEARHTAQVLARREARYRQLFEGASSGILLTDGESVLLANPAAAGIFGFSSSSEIENAPLHRLFPDPLLLPGPGTPAENRRLRGITKRGAGLELEVSITPQETDGQVGAQVMLRDVTGQMEAENRVRFLAHHDPLTGLPNRAYFGERLDQALVAAKEQGERTALLMVDLDHFKEINDASGHQVGDEVLCLVARELEASARTGDTVARLGGDEFAVIQTRVRDPEDAAVLAYDIIDRVSRLGTEQASAQPIGATIGIALCPDDDQRAEQLLRKADLALYRAKDDGRGRYVFYVDQINEAVQSRRRLLAALPAAYQKREFELVFQPIVDLRTGQVMMLEALLRWQHPRRGRIDAIEFIDIADAAGYLPAIAEWQFSALFDRLSGWRAAGVLRPVSVNLSLSQLVDKTLVPRLQSLLRRHGFDGSALEFEVNAQLVLGKARDAEMGIRRLKDLGASIALDNFGTGPSSLSLLRSVAVDRLKIDRSFVANVTSRSVDRALVRGIAQLAQALQLKVTAEGVERADQLTELKELGCREAQGHLIAPPLEADDVEGFLREQPRVPMPWNGDVASPRSALEKLH